MKQRWWVGLLLAVFVVAPGCKKSDAPSGNAAGVSKKTTELWQELGKYEGAYLKNWTGAFAEPPGSAMEVLEVFNEVAYAVTGPAGFWRKTVHGQWLGCEANADTEACEALTRALPELEGWDAFQAKIATMSDKQARRFLTKNHDKVMGYLKRYVPQSPSDSAMKETPFFQEHLAPAMGSL